MLEGRRGAALGLALFLGLAVFGVWMEISSSQNRPHTQADRRASERTNSEIDPRKPDERIADYTLWLERFTGLLAIIALVQIGFLIRTDVTARTSADAAKLTAQAAKASAEALPNIERAYVVLFINSHLIELRPRPTAGAPLPAYSLVVNYTFTNHGKTPAILREIRVGVRRSADRLPADAWAEEQRVPVAQTVLASGQSCSKDGYLTIRDREPMTDAVADLFVGGGLYFYFFGHVTYEDVFGDDRETQFCWRLGRDGFEEWGGREHNRRT
jgi:hypothetical protein